MRFAGLWAESLGFLDAEKSQQFVQERLGDLCRAAGFWFWTPGECFPELRGRVGCVAVASYDRNDLILLDAMASGRPGFDAVIVFDLRACLTMADLRWAVPDAERFSVQNPMVGVWRDGAGVVVGGDLKFGWRIDRLLAVYDEVTGSACRVAVVGGGL